MSEDYQKYKSWFNSPLNILESKDSIVDYLNNNFRMIDFYQEIYIDQISISNLIDKLKKGDFDGLNIVDLNRFRIFLDATLLIFNNEKVYNDYLQDKFAFQPFFDRLNDPKILIRERSFLEDYKKYLNTLFKISIGNFDSFFYSLDGELRRVWDQFKIIRNAFAHMQYGFYASDSTGFLSNFSIYNHDKGVTKEIGFVFEPILHLFIQQFFSNYSYSGLPYKHSWFEIDRDSKKLYFHEVTLSENYTSKYSGFDREHPMNQFTSILQTGDPRKIVKFIRDNKLNHEKSKIGQDKLDKYCKFYLEENGNVSGGPSDFVNQIKFLIDFDTEFSNFLVHMIQLNDRLIDYLRDKKLGVNRLEQILKSIEELREDEDRHPCFKYSFDILRMFNITSRMEDDDLPHINPADIDIRGIFLKNPLSLYEYYKNNKDTLSLQTNKDLRSNYIIERVRNAMAHGRYHIDLRDEGLFYIFEDKYNKRSEIIEISQNILKSFVRQRIFRERDYFTS
ncbi:hypothetical protein ACVRXS_05880 [Streptococcus orisratti]|uniref:hypothetical protein n=1 Tax=Streptococcus orisratti TaxID=114652 RepID=UPI000361790A|nr:hypothetical protein [Streptococcus orisratti]